MTEQEAPRGASDFFARVGEVVVTNTEPEVLESSRWDPDVQAEQYQALMGEVAGAPDEVWQGFRDAEIARENEINDLEAKTQLTDATGKKIPEAERAERRLDLIRKRQVLAANLYATGNESFRDALRAKLEAVTDTGEADQSKRSKGYAALVDVVEGLKTWIQQPEGQNMMDLADAIKEGLRGMPTPSVDTEGLTSSLTDILSMTMTSGEGGIFGSPEYILKQAKRISEDFHNMSMELYKGRMVENKKKRNGAGNGLEFKPATRKLSVPEDVVAPDAPRDEAFMWDDLTDAEKKKFEGLTDQLAAWHFLVETYTLTGPFGQMRQVIDFASKTMGKDLPTDLANLGMSLMKVERFAQTIEATNEKNTNAFESASPTGPELQSILWTMRLPLEFEVEGMESVVTDLSTAEYLDMYMGNDVDLEREGVVAYITNPKLNNGQPTLLSEVQNKTRWLRDENTRFAVPSGKESANPDRGSLGQWWMSLSNVRANEDGSAPYVNRVIDKLKAKGVRLDKIRGVKTTASDGNLLRAYAKDKDGNITYGDSEAEQKQWHPIARRAYNKALAGRDTDEARLEAAEARGMAIMIETVAVRHSRILSVGRDLAETLQLTPFLDPAQVRDKIPEIWIKTFGLVNYMHKYGIDPDTLRDLMNAEMKSIISWKAKLIDPLDIAISGNRDGSQAGYLWPLAPTGEGVPMIPPLLNKDGSKLTDKQLQILEAWSKKMEPHRINHDKIDERASRMHWIFTERVNGRRPAKNYKDLNEAHKRFYYDDDWEHHRWSAERQYKPGWEMLDDLNSMPEQVRGELSTIDWKPFLNTLGLDIADDYDLDGMEGAALYVDQRSMGYYMWGNLEKLFKLEAKYPEKATQAGMALSNLKTNVNQAVEPFLMKLLGGKSEGAGRFRPDDILEAAALGFYDVITIGKRTNKEAMTYVEGIAEIINKEVAPSMAAYMGADQRETLLDILLWVDTNAKKGYKALRFERKSGDGAQGTIDQIIEIPLTPPKDVRDINAWAREVADYTEALRDNPYFAVFVPEGAYLDDVKVRLINDKRYQELMKVKPNESEARAHRRARMQWLVNPEYVDAAGNEREETTVERIARMGEMRQIVEKWGYKLANPYVTAGKSPQHLVAGVRYGSGGWEATTNVEQGYGLHGHRGEENLLMSFVTMMMVDQMHLSEADRDNLITALKGREWLADKKNRRAELMDKWEKWRDEQNARLDNASGNGSTPDGA